MNIFEQFQVSVYWTVVTLATVGYGDIVPVTIAETVFIILWVLVGMTLFSYIVGRVISLVNKRR